MNKITHIIIFVLLLQLATALIPGDSHTVTTVPLCFDDVEIKISGVKDINLSVNGSDYSFQDCTMINDNYWNCPCDGRTPLPILLHTKDNITNEYDIVVQYYTQPESSYINSNASNGFNERHTATRTLNFNDLKVDYTPIKKKGFSFPDLPRGLDIFLITLFILLLFGVFVGLGYLLLRSFFDDNKKDDGLNWSEKNLIGLPPEKFEVAPIKDITDEKERDLQAELDDLLGNL